MRFFGAVGFGFPVRNNGVAEDQISERNYYGTVLNHAQNMSTSGSVLVENSTQTTISMVADTYALENFMAIKYIMWAGSLWVVSSVTIQRPRLLLTLGEVYHGPTAPAPSTP